MRFTKVFSYFTDKGRWGLTGVVEKIVKKRIWKNPAVLISIHTFIVLAGIFYADAAGLLSSAFHSGIAHDGSIQGRKFRFSESASHQIASALAARRFVAEGVSQIHGFVKCQLKSGICEVKSSPVGNSRGKAEEELGQVLTTMLPEGFAAEGHEVQGDLVCDRVPTGVPGTGQKRVDCWLDNSRYGDQSVLDPSLSGKISSFLIEHQSFDAPASRNLTGSASCQKNSRDGWSCKIWPLSGTKALRVQYSGRGLPVTKETKQFLATLDCAYQSPELQSFAPIYDCRVRVQESGIKL